MAELGHLTAANPTGFAKLGQPGHITKQYEDKSIYTLQIDHAPIQQEIKMAERGFDRLHAFQQGQAVALLLKLKADFQPGGIAETPEAFIRTLRKDLESIDLDLRHYASTVGRINPDQLILGVTV